MIRTRKLFLMVSRTDTGVARCIRALSRYPYNHVSLTMDPQLRSWYSFARFVQDAPFYGGFIREPVERFYAENGDAQVRIYRVDIPEVTAQALEKMVEKAGRQDNVFLYNYFDALASALGGHVQIANAHTCLSFACSILDTYHVNIRSLCEELAPWLIFEGTLSSVLPDNGRRDDPFFSHIGAVSGTVRSAKQLGLLTLRLISEGVRSIYTHHSHRTAH